MLGKVPEAFRSEYDLNISLTACPQHLLHWILATIYLFIHSVEGLAGMPQLGQLILVNDVRGDFIEVTNELSLQDYNK